MSSFFCCYKQDSFRTYCVDCQNQRLLNGTHLCTPHESGRPYFGLGNPRHDNNDDDNDSSSSSSLPSSCCHGFFHPACLSLPDSAAPLSVALPPTLVSSSCPPLATAKRETAPRVRRHRLQPDVRKTCRQKNSLPSGGAASGRSARGRLVPSNCTDLSQPTPRLPLFPSQNSAASLRDSPSALVSAHSQTYYAWSPPSCRHSSPATSASSDSWPAAVPSSSSPQELLTKIEHVPLPTSACHPQNGKQKKKNSFLPNAALCSASTASAAPTSSSSSLSLASSLSCSSPSAATSSLRSGCHNNPHGVYFDASKRLWRVQWRIGSGRHRKVSTRGFSVVKHGSLEARRLAVEYKLLMEQTMNSKREEEEQEEEPEGADNHVKAETKGTRDPAASPLTVNTDAQLPSELPAC